MFRVICASLLFVLSVASPVNAERFQVRGEVGAIALDEDRPWFSLQLAGIQFLLESGTVKDELSVLLNGANMTGRSVNVVFETNGASVDRDKGIVQYRFCEARIEELEVTASGTSCSDQPSEGMSDDNPAYADLITGVAAAASEDIDPALAGLSRALEHENWSPPVRALLLFYRAQTALTAGTRRFPPGSETGDRHLMDAASDFQSLSEIQPDNFVAAHNRIFVLGQLGAYPEALVAIEEFEKNWPDESVATIQKVMTYRNLGRPDLALKTLQEFDESSEGENGMMFHYHLAHTLLELGQNQAAAMALTTGLEHQPDYAWAYLIRACAYARMGKVDDALADAEQGLNHFNQAPADHTDRYRAAIVASIEELRKDSDEAAPTACPDVYFDGFRGRQRSALLPAAPTVELNGTQ